jgi:hypothetical protein
MAAKAKGVPLFIDKSEIVFEFGVDMQTIDRWVAAGTFPPPHSRSGERKALWLHKHFDYYVATGHWPKDAFPSYD